MTLETGKGLDIVQARSAGGYSLEIEFSDGFSHKVDFEPFLSASVQPEIRKYLNADNFKRYIIKYGNLVWGDYDLCFPIEDLYSGRLLVGQEPASMVAEDTSEYGAQ